MNKKLIYLILAITALMVIFYFWGMRLPTEKAPTALEARVSQLENNQQEIIKYLNEILPKQVVNEIENRIKAK